MNENAKVSADESASTGAAGVSAAPKKSRKRTTTKLPGKAPVKRITAAKKQSAARPKAAAKPVSEITDDDVRLRAYFIAENRYRSGLAGDPDGDWVEARRQLRLEFGKP